MSLLKEKKDLSLSSDSEVLEDAILDLENITFVFAANKKVITKIVEAASSLALENKIASEATQKKIQQGQQWVQPTWWRSKIIFDKNISCITKISGKRRGLQCSAFSCSKRKKTEQRSDSEGSSDEESSVKRQFQRTFHLFPANTDRKNIWLANIRHKNWKPGKHSLICSDHFLEKDVDRTGQVVRLRDCAIPSRFKIFPSHLKKVSKGQKLPSRKHMDVPDPIPNPVEEMSSSPKHIHHDHTYHIAESPCKLKKDLEKRKNKGNEKANKIMQTKILPSEKSVNSMKTVVKHLRHSQIISSNCEEVLKQTFSGASIDLMKRMTSGKTSGKGCKYTPELKSFALTLQCYSATAYEFVRRTFNLALPHQSQMHRWYSKIPADPGFTKPAFEALGVKVAKAECVGQRIVFAKDALVFMAVHVNGSWKVPLAYFFIDGLSGSECGNLVKVCIERLSDVEVKVCSLTCDGPSCHFTMMSHLGAPLDPDNLVPSFCHPSHPSEKIHVLLDVCLVEISSKYIGNSIAFNYILGLKDTSGKKVYTTRRKPGFVGFLVAIKSTKQLFHDLVEIQNAPLKYLLMYKFSQDHLKLFFGAIRSAEDSTTTQQHSNLRQLVNVFFYGAVFEAIKEIVQNKTLQTSFMLLIIPTTLLEYKEAAVSYISGYLARMAEKTILCVNCCKALGSTQNPVKSTFLALKDRGGLFKPTQSFVKVCEETEKCFNRTLASTDGHLPRCTGIPDAIATSVLGSLNLSSVFRELDSHVFDSAVDDNHVFSLIKTLAKCYCKVRLYHLGKEATQKLSGPKIRKKLTKLVLFKHQ
eukprot:gene1534-1697_t